jgi:hypothetical protein
VPLVERHLAHLQPANDQTVRRFANFLKPATIEELCLVMIADHFGRPPKPRDIHVGMSEYLNCEPRRMNFDSGKPHQNRCSKAPFGGARLAARQAVRHELINNDHTFDANDYTEWGRLDGAGRVARSGVARRGGNTV